MIEFEFSHVDDAQVMEFAPGIQVRPLWEGADGAKALVMEMDAGARLGSLDVHESGPEFAYVLEGVFGDGTAQHPAGTFIHGPQGSSHLPQSEVGCKVFVFYPRG